MLNPDVHHTANHTAPSTDGLRYRPFRFHLRTVWLVVTLLCVALGLMGQIGPLASLALVLLIGLVLCHVVGNTLGTRLRDEMTKQLRADAKSLRRLPPAKREIPKTPSTKLRQKTRVVGWKMILSCATCALAAGGFGAYHFAGGVWSSLRPQEIVLVGVSLAILGGLFAIVAMTFVSVMLRCLGEFRRGQTRVQPPHE